MSIFHEAHLYIEQYGYLAVSLGIFLEDSGMPAPGETLPITGRGGGGRAAESLAGPRFYGYPGVVLISFGWFRGIVGRVVLTGGSMAASSLSTGRVTPSTRWGHPLLGVRAVMAL